MDFLLGLTNPECGSKCETNLECNFYSYNTATQMCFLYDDCSDIDLDQQDFTTSVNKCGPGWKLLVVGGEDLKNGEALNSIKVIDVENPKNVCQDWTDHPQRIKGAFGDKIDEKGPLICGGYQGLISNSKCFYLGDSEPAVHIQNKSFASTFSYNNSLLVFGGYFDGDDLNTIEEIRPPNAEIVGNLPFNFTNGCVVGIERTIFLVAGIQNGKVSNKTWLGHTRNWELWLKGPELLQPRKDHGCAFLKDFGVVVIGGMDPNDPGANMHRKSVEVLLESGGRGPTKFVNGEILNFPNSNLRIILL